MVLRASLVSLLNEAQETRIYLLDRSIELALEVLIQCDSESMMDLKAKALSQLSLYYMIRGDNDLALQHAKESMTLYEVMHDEKGIADAKYSIAGVYYKTDNYHIGLVFLIDALTIYKKFNDYYNISRCEKSLGTVYEYSDDQPSAIKANENAIAAAKKAKDLNLESNAYNNLSGIYVKEDNIELADSLIEKSINIKKQTGDLRGLAFAIYGKAKVLMAMQKYKKAENEFLEAISIHTQMGERLGLAMCYHKMAKMYLKTNQLVEAKKTIAQGVALSEQYNITIIKFKCYYLLYQIYKSQNNKTVALEYLEQYLKEKENVLNTQTLKVIDNYDMLVQMKIMQREAALQKEKAEMIEKNNRAEEAARVRQEFLSTMSHEIRTPLNAITTIVSLLNERSSEEEQKLIKSLKFSSNLLMWIINDILDFTKLDLGKMKLELYPVELHNLLGNIGKTYEYQAREKGIIFRLESDIPEKSAYHMDETRMTQILGNLINNAVKFTDRGTVTLHVSLIKESKLHDVVLFRVIDTGEGISAEDLTKIFDSFSQVKNTITRKKGGTGLGLAIVKNLVKLHGSTIGVYSELGVGSEFQFQLKLKKAPLIVESKVEAISVSLDEKRLLLAEDNAINAFIATSLLSKWGIITDHAINGLEAVRKAQEQTYDFILMDIHMPEMDGFEATAIIRQGDSPNKNIPIYGLTADISAKDNMEFQHYFDGFLLKPLQVDKLYNALIAQIN